MSKQRTLYFDILNILACFGVICLHQNGVVHWYPVDTNVFREALVVETVFYWPVPVFFMISGATLMTYRSRYSTKEFLIRRAKRVLIPYLVFSLIMLTWRCAIKELAVESISVRTLINIFMTNQQETLYWFFIPMFAVYCCIPVLSLLKDNHRILWYMFGMAFITISCCPVIFSLFNISWNYDLGFPMTGGYLIFAILGYLISVTDISRKKRYCIYVLALASVLFRYFGTIILSNRIQTLDRTLFGYMHFHSVFLAAGVFILCKQIHWEKLFHSDRAVKAITSISACSFGIYLIQNVLFYYEADIWGVTVDSLRYRTVGCFITYGIALLVVFIAKKIPVLNKIIP